MKKTMILAALMLSGTAIAQSAQTTATQPTTTTQPSGQTVDDPSQATGPAGVTQQGTDPNGQATAPAGTNQPMATEPMMNNTQSMGRNGTAPQGNAYGQQGQMQGQGNNMGQGNATGQSGTMGQSYSGRGGPATGEYPACSRTVTDSCIQTYERGVRRSRR